MLLYVSVEIEKGIQSFLQIKQTSLAQFADRFGGKRTEFVD
jgi:hypothetical protein